MLSKKNITQASTGWDLKHGFLFELSHRRSLIENTLPGFWWWRLFWLFFSFAQLYDETVTLTLYSMQKKTFVHPTPQKRGKKLLWETGLGAVHQEEFGKARGGGGLPPPSYILLSFGAIVTGKRVAKGRGRKKKMCRNERIPGFSKEAGKEAGKKRIWTWASYILH